MSIADDVRAAVRKGRQGVRREAPGARPRTTLRHHRIFFNVLVYSANVQQYMTSVPCDC